jgi:hypothetical protein
VVFTGSLPNRVHLHHQTKLLTLLLVCSFLIIAWVGMELKLLQFDQNVKEYIKADIKYT